MRGHCYDGLVGLAGCDKSLPGMMMVMVRLNVPSVFMYGGSILPGRFKGRDVTVQDVFEAVGAHSAGNMSDEDLHLMECVACPSSGSCGGQFTANTMACVSEAIGLALPGSAGAPAPYDSRDAYAEASGEAVMRLIEKNIRPRDIVTKKSLINAARIVASSGGSTNGALHLPAIAHEAGIDFDLFDVADIFRDTPYIADLKPGGKYVAKDMYEVGGVPMLMKALLEGGYFDGDCMTVTGKTIGENLERVKFPTDQKVIYPVSNPITKTGGVVGLKGNLAPDGAIVKVAGMEKQQFTGKARCFDCEEDAFECVELRQYEAGDVFVIRYEGPKGGPGMREMLATTSAIYGQGMGDKVALITDGPPLGRDARLLHSKACSLADRSSAALPVNCCASHPGHLHDGAVGGEVALEADHAAGLGDRVADRIDDLLVRRELHALQVLADRLAGHGHAVAVEVAALEQRLHQNRHAADLVHILGDVFAARFHVGDIGRLAEDVGDVLQGEVDSGLVGDRRQVQRGIGRAARAATTSRRSRAPFWSRCRAGGCPSRSAASPPARGFGVGVAAIVGRRRSGRTGQRQADRLRYAGHGVGGELAAA